MCIYNLFVRYCGVIYGQIAYIFCRNYQIYYCVYIMLILVKY